MRKQNRTVLGAAVIVMTLLAAGRAVAGNLDPTDPPGPTMHTLGEIYQQQAITTNMIDYAIAHVMYNEQQVHNVLDITSNIVSALQVLLSPQSLSPTTTMVNGGYYAATTLTAVDADLAAANIRTNVTIFGITGTFAGGGIVYTNASAAVPKTGLTTPYAAGDDGSYQKGVAWPNPRFTIQADSNCVLDNLTGLVWARNANLSGGMSWSNAIIYCEGLTYGGQDDWRLPNVRELQSLIDYGRFNPMLCNTAGTGQWTENDPFTGNPANYYWTSTAINDGPDYAQLVCLINGQVSGGGKTQPYSVWPVRGGQ